MIGYVEGHIWRKIHYTNVLFCFFDDNLHLLYVIEIFQK